jgi:DNA end-binding protein Ku
MEEKRRWLLRSGKGSISFGLLSIPIRLYPAARSEHIKLHQIHKKCPTRLRQPLYCPTCHRIVDRSEVVKGYEYEKGQYVLVENEELKKIMLPSSRTMEIQAFVKGSRIDPMFFESSYFALPEKQNANRTYFWLRRWKTRIALESRR